jgi:hypothetical protein
MGLAAFALTRFRFVRALLASALVNIPFVVAVFCVPVALTQRGPVALVAAFVFVTFLVASSIVFLTVALTIIDCIHRRLVALVSVYFALLFPLSILASLSYWDDTWKKQFGADTVASFLASLFIIAAAVFAIVLTIELGSLAFWAILAPKTAYISVRGWRPGWAAPVRNFTHQLGFPAFAAQIRRGRFSLGALYFLIGILNVVFFGLLATPLWLPRPDNIPSQLPYLTLLLAVPGGVLVLQLLGLGRMANNAARQHAAKLYQSVREWDDRPPVLFLRSFDQDKVPIPAQTRDPILQWPAGLGRAQELDELILEAGAPFGPIIAIGDPRNPIPPLGAARIFVRNADQDWKSVVADLIAACRAVVICPHTSSGVAWEIEQVRPPTVLARTIILASPKMSAEDTSSLFAEITGGPITLKRRQRAVAAFQDPVDGWTLLSARRLTVQTYTVALNRAIQHLLQPGPDRPARRGASALGK